MLAETLRGLDLAAIARDAVAEARAANLGTPAPAVFSMVLDDACEIARCAALDAALDAMGTQARVPSDYGLDIVTPHVVAALGFDHAAVRTVTLAWGA